MLRPRCEDVCNKGLIKYQISEVILLHGDPNDEFQLALEEFRFHGHILTCYVGKYSIIVLNMEVPHQCQTLQCLFSRNCAFGGHIIASNFRIDEAYISACHHCWAGLSLHVTFSGVSIFLEARNCVTLHTNISAIVRCRILRLSAFVYLGVVKSRIHALLT